MTDRDETSATRIACSWHLSAKPGRSPSICLLEAYARSRAVQIFEVDFATSTTASNIVRKRFSGI